VKLGRVLVCLMKKKRLSGLELANRLGVEPSFVSQVRFGKRPIPRASIGRWIKALQLNAEEAENFRLLALLRLSPPEISDVINSLRHQVELLRFHHRILCLGWGQESGQSMLGERPGRGAPWAAAGGHEG
jgi:transcriptional regulator with XRE-family HTH domain